MKWEHLTAAIAFFASMLATGVGRASVFTNGATSVYRYDDAAHISLTQAFSEAFEDVQVGPDGFIYATSNDLGVGGVQRIDPRTGVAINYPSAVPAGRENYAIPLGIAFSPSGTMFLGSNTFPQGPAPQGVTGVLRLDVPTQAFVPFATIASTGSFVTVNDVAVSPTSDVYAVVLKVGIVRFDGTTGASLGTVVSEAAAGLSAGGSRINFGPDGKLYANDAVGNINRFDPVTGAPLGTFIAATEGVAHTVSGFNFGIDGRAYVTSGTTRQILRYDANSGAFLDLFSSDPGIIRSPRWEAVYIPEPSSLTLLAAFAANVRRRRSAGATV